jgi:hypothetical protein
LKVENKVNNKVLKKSEKYNITDLQQMGLN